MSDQKVKSLTVLLADTYATYLKTQNYHWHVVGPYFPILHALFEKQYRELSEAVDEIAERIRILGHAVPATFSDFQRLKTIPDGHADVSANQMLLDLIHDHTTLLNGFLQALPKAQHDADEGTADLLTSRIVAHEKMRWILTASCEKL